jgi:hypothetical protein
MIPVQPDPAKPASANSDIKSVCVYCGASPRVADSYKQTAIRMGEILGENGLRLVYGGGRSGLMGLVADATLKAGGAVFGAIPGHIASREISHTGLTELRVVNTMHERKQLLVDHADAFVILPGGLGTLDEFFEIMTWRQLGLHDMPVVLVNTGGYWTPLVQLIDKLVEEGFARESDRHHLQIVDTVEDVMKALKAAPREHLDPQTKWI